MRGRLREVDLWIHHFSVIALFFFNMMTKMVWLLDEHQLCHRRSQISGLVFLDDHHFQEGNPDIASFDFGSLEGSNQPVNQLPSYVLESLGHGIPVRILERQDSRSQDSDPR